MTNSADIARHSSAASNVEETASAWVEYRDREDWNAANQLQLDAWLAESLENRIAYWRLEAAWDRTVRLAALHAPEATPLSSAWNSRVLRRIAKISGVLGVFAVVAVAVMSYLLEPRYQTYATTIGGHETLALSDGSLVELSTDTVVKLIDTARLRAATLERGEAYFEIRHDAMRPFVVTVGSHRITDLGTKFLIRSDADRVEVSLLEGRARFDSMSTLRGRNPAVLTPGEVAVATADSMFVTRKPERTLSDALGWRRGMLVFYHTSLADAATEFNRYNREPLIIGDASTGRLVVNGAFPTNGTTLFIQATRDIFGLRVEHRPNGIVISR